MPPNIIMFSEIVEANGKTIRENNLAKRHHYPLGTVVEVDLRAPGYFEDPQGPEPPRVRTHLIVCGHGRDCDGTPLYCLGDRPYPPLTDKDYPMLTKDQLVAYIKFFHPFTSNHHGEWGLKDTGNKVKWYGSFLEYLRESLG
jgi:hypothetical protein